MATAGGHGTPVSLSAGSALYDVQNGKQLARLAMFVDFDSVIGFLTSGLILREA